MSVCIFVCPLAYLRNHTAELTNFLKLRLGVARSSAGGVAVRHIIPVLWMTSCFHNMGSMVRHVYSLHREPHS